MSNRSKPKRPAKPKTPPRPPRDPAIEAELQAMIDRQGVRESSKFENIVGIGAHLWASDEEVVKFLERIRPGKSGQPREGRP